MNVCVVGTGYVGLVTGTCLAEMGNQVWCIDIDQQKIDQLKQGQIPIYEPGLEELVKRNVKEERLFFSTSLQEGLKDSLFCFIAVGTPSQPDGSVDLQYVEAVAKEIGQTVQTYTVVVDKSTVPVGTAEFVRQIIDHELAKRNDSVEFDIVSNPEFLKEGAALDDFMRPDRIIVGADNERAAKLMEELYEPFIRSEHLFLLMDIPSAEMAKYAANAMLATRISFMNELSRLCDRVGANILRVKQGIGSDKRIGMAFLNAGPGYGGSCFPKDVKELIHSGVKQGVAMNLLKAVDRVNEEQKHYMLELIIRHFGDDLSGLHFAVWGLAYKPQTDDMREAPAIVIIRELIKRGAEITAYDPEAMDKAKLSFGDLPGLHYATHMTDMLENKNALILLTEWQKFMKPNFTQIKEKLAEPILFDGRNIYNAKELRKLGFVYFGIGTN